MLYRVCIGALHARDSPVIDVTGRGSVDHHFSVDSLQTSVAESCMICAPFWDRLSPSTVEVLRKKQGKQDSAQQSRHFPLTTFTLRKSHTGYQLVISMTDFARNLSPTRAVTSALQFALVPVQSLPPAVDDYGAKLGNILEEDSLLHNTSSPASWSRATAWLSRCRNSHTACNQTSQSDWLPTRLLHVNEEPGSDLSIRLACTADRSKMANDDRYVTLSHCWGSVQITKLLRSNWETFTQGILLSCLPKTFRDAIAVTYRLGIRYIWIDSLCIMQDFDDLSDWNVEAALMDKVYLNSFCNISAAATKDGSQGLFQTSQFHCLRNPEIDLHVEDRTQHSQVVRCILHDHQFWYHHVDDSPSNKRAWVLQERLLSPRNLLFGRHQLLWACREFMAAESYPYGFPQGLVSNIKNLHPESLGFNASMEDSKLELFQDIWKQIVWLYSKSSLAVPGDKLIAISALAKHTRKASGDEDFAGL